MASTEVWYSNFGEDLERLLRFNLIDDLLCVSVEESKEAK